MHLKLTAGIVGLTLCAGMVQAAPDERWEQKPTHDEEWAALAASGHPDVGGFARMRCAVTPERYLADCQTVMEAPVGLGLGSALLKLAPRYRLTADAARREVFGGHIIVANTWADSGANWLRKPTAAQLLGVWPTGAVQQGLDGRAVIQCVVTVQGALSDCLVVSEYPKASHFGDAAIALAPQLLMKPAMRNGAPVPSDIHIPVNWTGIAAMRRLADSMSTRKVMSASVAWSAAPTFADVAAAYPPKAVASRQGGHVTLDCGLRRDGGLATCTTLSEEPKGAGFGQAAKALAKQFKADPAAAAQAADVQVPFTFDPAMLQAAPMLGKPQWARLPSTDELKDAFKGVQTETDELRAVLTCTVQQGGAVEACAATAEQPAGSGIGAAALALAPTFRISTWTSEGLPTVGGRVRIPLRYVVREPAASAPTSAPAARP